MKPVQFCFVYVIEAVALTLILLSSTQYVDSQNATGRGFNSPVNCDVEKFVQYSEDFTMKMGLCRPNISVICASRPSHPCTKNHTSFRTTAIVNGYTGQCLIEANASAASTLRFYIEARRIKNPNEEGSRSLTKEGAEEHQRGKCILKYMCHKKAIQSVSMECGSVLVNEQGHLHNFTKRRAFWKAPPTFKESVYFTTTIGVSIDKLALDIQSTNIFAAEVEQKEVEINNTGKKGEKGTKLLPNLLQLN